MSKTVGTGENAIKWALQEYAEDLRLRSWSRGRTAKSQQPIIGANIAIG